MRLIAEFDKEKDAFCFHQFLLQKKIKKVYEDATTKQKKQFRIWVLEEDDLEVAKGYLAKYLENPEDPQFNKIEFSCEKNDREDFPQSIADGDLILGERTQKKKVVPVLTGIILLVCLFIFGINYIQEITVLETQGALAYKVGTTPLVRKFLFEYPKEVERLRLFVIQNSIKTLEDVKSLPEDKQKEFHTLENAPMWLGLLHLGKYPKEYHPKLFSQIVEGQVWRLFTPALLHRDFLHIFFNMVWLWILGRQIEERIKIFRMVLLVIVLAVGANVCQYLASGPFFLGFSGVVVGMAGFIWIRQKIAPWEGYPLRKGTLLFLFAFVVCVVALEVGILIFDLFTKTEIVGSIANTAHIVGGLTGIFLAKLRFFSRRSS